MSHIANVETATTAQINLIKQLLNSKNLTSHVRVNLEAQIVFGTDTERSKNFVDGYYRNLAVPLKFRNKKNYNKNYGRAVFTEAQQIVQRAIQSKLV